MRHRKNLRKLGKTSKHRQAMLRNMVTDFFTLGRIKSTDIKLKELKRYAEKLITLAKRGTLHARRLAAAKIRDKEVLKKLFEEIAPHFSERPGGYTRIIKLGYRRGDNAPISMIELLEDEYTIKPDKKKAKPKKAKKAKPAETDDATASKSTKKESAEELGLIESEASSEQEPPKEAKAEAKADAKSEGEAPAEEETAQQEAKAEEASPEQPEEELKAEEEKPQESPKADPKKKKEDKKEKDTK